MRTGPQPMQPAGAPADAELWDAVSLTIERAERALVLAAGVAVEAIAPRATFPVREGGKTTVNDSLPVAITVFNRGHAVVSLRDASINVVGGDARARTAPAVSEAPRTVATDSAVTISRFAIARAPTTSWWQAVSRDRKSVV